jgi:CRISPR-associated protein Cst1
MNTKTLDLIEKISDFIIADGTDIKSNISKLRTDNNSSLRSFLIRLVEKNYKKGSEKPLITLREYVEYLFPLGTNWKEIRDLMLICVFQKLHEKQIMIDDLGISNEENSIEIDIDIEENIEY